jgi:hypothetical protein
MPVPSGDQFKLYHGTAGKVKGGKLQPGADGVYGAGVYSTDQVSKAEEYARRAAIHSDIDPETGEPDGRTTRPLFGTVYEVDSKNARRVRSSFSGNYYLDVEPVSVKNAVSFPKPEYDSSMADW